MGSFKEYVLIDQDRPIVDVLYRKELTYWKITSVIGLDKTVHLSSLGIDVSMADIYNNISDLKDPQYNIDFEE